MVTVHNFSERELLKQDTDFITATEYYFTVNSYLNNKVGLFFHHIFSNSIYIWYVYNFNENLIFTSAHFSLISGADKLTRI